MNILISACLLGLECRYDGKDNYVEEIGQLKQRYHLIPICPEIAGGLGIPRLPCEIRAHKVLTKDGREVTGAFEKGAKEALKLAKLLDCRYAILKERSPSCGHQTIYDGSFTKKLVSGNGVTARLLHENGIEILGESQIGQLL